MRGANKVNKQIDIADFIRHNNISLIVILESKVKRAGLGLFIFVFFPTGVLLASNLDWHKGGRIFRSR